MERDKDIQVGTPPTVISAQCSNVKYDEIQTSGWVTMTLLSDAHEWSNEILTYYLAKPQSHNILAMNKCSICSYRFVVGVFV